MQQMCGVELTSTTVMPLGEIGAIRSGQILFHINMADDMVINVASIQSDMSMLYRCLMILKASIARSWERENV